MECAKFFLHNSKKDLLLHSGCVILSLMLGAEAVRKLAEVPWLSDTCNNVIK